MQRFPGLLSCLSACAASTLVACGGASDQAQVANSLTAPEPVRSELPGPVGLDSHAAGTAGELALVAVSYGRLVDLYDRDSSSGAETLQYTDLVVDPTLLGDGVDYALDQHAGRGRLVVLHPAGSAEFSAAFERASGDLPAVPGEAGLGTLAAVPLDAVLSLRFDDLLEEESLGAETVRVEFGGAPLPLRVLADPNHGGYADLDGDGRSEFHATRVIVDPSVSRLDQLRAGGGHPSGTGWPASARADEANLELFLGALEGAAGAPLSAGRGDRIPRLTFRSGGPTLLTGDPREGLLASSGAPRVLGEQRIDVLGVQALGGRRFLADYTFDVAACRMRPAPGDVLEFPGALCEVLAGHQGFDPNTGVVSNVRLFLLAGTAAGVTSGPARYVAPFEAASDVPACFVSFSPEPSGPPAQGLSADATISVRFDRPMDPGSFEALQTFTVTRGWAAPPLEELVVGSIQGGLQAERFSFVPSVPFSTVAPISPAAYVFDLDGSAGGVRGAGGAALEDDLPAVTFQLDPAQPSRSTSGIVLAFDQLDEDGNGWPELRGQFLLDLAAERIRARPVARFSAAVDATQSLVGVMVPLAAGVQTPLSDLGSKLMSVWRYSDLGFGLLDENYHNLDVEGLYWSPQGGQVLLDRFSEFQMSLGHAGFLPDEDLDISLLPKFPQSGLSNTYAQNYLTATQGAVVHPKAAGYLVDPLDLTTSAGGTPLMPWPLNRGMPSSQYTYWTWRDTAIQGVGAPNGVGADTSRMSSVLGGASSIKGLYPRDEVPTIGLPLLSEFRTYPDAGAFGHNGLKVSIAINSSASPYFRTFSTGGLLNSGQVLLVDPDQELTGSGGVNPVTGTKTVPRDNAFSIGQADFVVRVSRAHTVWFDTGAAPTFGTPVIEPAANFQPPGTQVVLAFRGAASLASTGTAVEPWENAGFMDPYGDPYDAAQWQKLSSGPVQNNSFAVTEWPVSGDGSWTSALSDLDGARFVQARITLLSNPETGRTPSVSGLGLPFVN